MRFKLTALLATGAALNLCGAAMATDLEVTHWWTSGGEAAAVAELAKAFDATGNHWVDGAIAGGGNTARPIMVRRITGGDPMGAFQFNTGRQAEELIEAGLLRDLTDVATKEKWREAIRPASLLDGCTVDGKVYCVVVNIHSWQWLWLSNKAFADAGVPVPKNWDEFVAAAPALEKAGKIPLAIGGQPWQTTGAFNVLIPAIAGKDVFLKVYKDHDAEAAAGPEIAKVFKAADDARRGRGVLRAAASSRGWNRARRHIASGVGRRVVPRTPSRNVHDAGSRQKRQRPGRGLSGRRRWRASASRRGSTRWVPKAMAAICWRFCWSVHPVPFISV